MRQTLKDRRKQLSHYRGTPASRLLTMVLMLAIMGLIFVRLRDPNTWRWFARDNDEQIVLASETAGTAGLGAVHPAVQTSSAEKAPPSASPQASPAGKQKEPSPAAEKKTIDAAEPAAVASGKAGAAAPAAGRAAAPKAPPAADPELTATGPTDLDPIEQEDIKDAISVITDGTLEMSKEENPAYFQILEWVDHQPPELLRKRAKRDVLYSEFRLTPDTMRLQIVELNLNVRQIIRYTKPPKNGITEPITTRDGHPLYEVRGVTQEGGTNIYIGVVTGLPQGMPIGTAINENAKLVGYFFKLQGYISRQQQIEAEESRKRPVPLKAPLILGRLVWTAPPSVAEEGTPIWLLATIGGVAVVVIVGWVWATTRRSRSRDTLSITTGAGADTEGPGNWLDQAESGRLGFEPVPEATGKDDGAALEDGSLGRFSGNIFGDNGESNNGNSSVRT